MIWGAVWFAGPMTSLLGPVSCRPQTHFHCTLCRASSLCFLDLTFNPTAQQMGWDWGPSVGHQWESEPGCRQSRQGTESHGALGVGIPASHAVPKPGAMGQPLQKGGELQTCPPLQCGGRNSWGVSGRLLATVTTGLQGGTPTGWCGAPRSSRPRQANLSWSSQGTFTGTSLLASCFRCLNLH